MKSIAFLTALGVLSSPALTAAQGDPSISSAEPFKLGTFEIAGEPRIGIVLRDTLVVDLVAANRALQRDPAYPAVPVPADMVALIGRDQYGMKTRLYEIVNYLVRSNRLTGAQRGLRPRRQERGHPGAAYARQDAERRREFLYPCG